MIDYFRPSNYVINRLEWFRRLRNYFLTFRHTNETGIPIAAKYAVLKLEEVKLLIHPVYRQPNHVKIIAVKLFNTDSPYPFLASV